jgi:UDP-N-acetylmuramate dehydrogenase
MGDWTQLLSQVLGNRNPDLAKALKRDEPLKRHTTLRIGGPARAFVVLDAPDDLKAVLEFCRSQSLVRKVIGAGSNLLVSDQGFPGVVIRLGKGFAELKNEDGAVKVGAGLLLAELVAQAQALGLGGAEFLWGIPGTIGGAVRMNAGAYGQEIGDIVTALDVIRADGREEVLSRKDVRFSYRRTSLPADTVVTGAVLKLKSAEPEEIERKVADFRKRRLETQPKGASAGCVFRNPKDDSAGRMIDQAGLKGKRVGGAVVSSRHANFIVNQGDARCSDVLQLMELMRLKVEEKFGVVLEPEVEVLAALDKWQ